MYEINVRNLNFSYEKKTILKNINLKINPSEFIAIIGPNGGGKSTFLKLILGLLKPKSGEISIDCKKTDLAYVPQIFNTNLNFNLKVIDVVLMAFLDKKPLFFYSKKDRQKALKSLCEVGMEKYANEQINNLSGGQKQRVFIARALACNAKYLFLDEPTANIDIKGQRDIFELLKTLNEVHKKGIVVVCHDISVVLAYADKIVHINQTLTIHKNNKNTQNQNLQSHIKHDLEHICQVELLTNHCSHE